MLPQVSSSGSALLGAVSQHISADSQGGRRVGVVGVVGVVFNKVKLGTPWGWGNAFFFSPGSSEKHPTSLRRIVLFRIS